MFDFFVEETGSNKNKNTSDNNTIQSTSKRERMKRLYFKSTGVKKYRFTIESEVLVANLHSKTTIENSWVLQIQKITDDGYILDLVTYDSTLKECNEQGMKELFQITRYFQKIYDEVKVSVYLDGTIKQVINQNQLIEKWKAMKFDSIQYFGDETNLDQYFAVNDETFSKPEFIKKLASEIEFFFIYMQLGGYGQKLNSYRELKRDNAFRTGEIIWDLDFTGKDEIETNSPLGEMNINGFFQPSKSWAKQAYGQVQFVNVDELKLDFNLKGKYTFYNDNGWLKEALLTLNEIIHPKLLFHKMNYKIQEIS